jgi:hypothetical protein
MKVSLKQVGSPTQHEVEVGDLTLYFSYDTCVGYWYSGEGTVVSENVWSVTTGKHLNYWQADKKARVPNDEFNTRLAAVLAQIA